MPKIIGEYIDTYAINSNGSKYVFTNTYYGHDPAASSISEQGSDNRIVMNGLVESAAGSAGIELTGSNVTLRIGAEGTLRGAGAGLSSSGANAHITNAGLIVGAASYGAASLSGEGVEFRNRGTIAGPDIGIDFRGDGSVVVNEHGASIAMTGSGSRAVWMLGIAGDTLRFVNHGEVGVHTGWAVQGLDSDDKVRNTGTITGDIGLGNGNDMVDNRGGVIRGVFQGGAGDDTLITDSNLVRLVETSGQGEDQVKSTVTYALGQFVEQLVLIGRKNIMGIGTSDDDRIYGNVGKNQLHGLEGIDTLDGKRGNDVLYGGLGGDHFYFNKGYDRDTIDDFQQGSDQVHIENWAALSTIEKVKSHASDHGQDVWISVRGDTLVIKGLHKADLTDGDFVFL